MIGRETRVLLRHHLEEGASTAEVGRPPSPFSGAAVR